ncbi:hypothetical protein RJ527_14310 [Thalassospiraceae bacterium LMO-SO8]|nr:hypothetical protein [Alphaproteobacteria bacterium LMO-S08]WND75197.1 hypothetical protein RJ527_14310 [Thalassospiraceae bacterium LMO-SO8]
MPNKVSKNSIPTFKELLSTRVDWLLGAADTKEASEITSTPIASLVTMRSIGNGPKYFRPAGHRAVRYLRLHLYEWMLEEGFKANTADCGSGVDLSDLFDERGNGHVSPS